MGVSKAKQAEVAQRRAEAIRMKIAGVDYGTIAERLGYSSRQHAVVDIHRALERGLKEQAAGVEIMREIEAARLDRLQAAFWLPATQGDAKAAEVVLKILARRAKFAGLDEATRVEVVTIDQIDAQIAELRARLALNDSKEELPADLVEEE